MPEYEITFARSARRELENLDRKVVSRVFTKIESLARNPRATGVIKLQGSVDLWRIRVGNYRVLFRIDDRARTIDIVAVGDRKEVYRPK